MQLHSLCYKISIMIIKNFVEPPIDNNNYLVIDEISKEAVLIDCSAYDENVFLELKKYGAKLKYILLTHGHFDHMTGLNEMSEGVQVLLHNADAEWISELNTYLPMVGMPYMEEEHGLMAYFRKGDRQDIFVAGNFLEEERIVPLQDSREKQVLLSNADVDWAGESLILKPFQVVVLSVG